jgi:ATP-dependent protease HslVU (ClpYQ) peptidase subunit
MTTIAWDGKTLAADKRASCGSLARTVTKIFRFNDELLGYSGNFDCGMEMLDWYRNGRDPAKFPLMQRDRDDWTTFVVISKSGIGFYERAPVLLAVEDPFYATGSGRDFATAALACGKNAREAVELACRFDVGSGNGIDTLEL